MLSLDQVRLLENRVVKAVGKIESLTAENARLRAQLSGLQTRVGELEGLVRSFKDDQGRIEEGILNALDRLSAFEDSAFTGHDTPELPADKTADNSDFKPEVSASVEQPAIAENVADESTAQVSSPQTDIDADWLTSGEEPQTTSPSGNGQMDIF